MKNTSDKSVNITKNRYPYSIVWTPLPLITAIFPFIGHTGICTSEGIIHDFSGPYTITVDDMGFGNPTKYVQLSFNDADLWDDAIREGDGVYNGLNHNLFWNNCHSHVAFVLNKVEYQGGKWNMVNIAWLLFWKGKHTDILGAMKTYIGFLIFLALISWLYLFR